MGAYFERQDESRFRATKATGGAWTPHEQHIAPALGLLAHAIEVDRDARRPDAPQLGRFSADILGTLPLDVVEVSVRVLRPGRTIELVEATMSSDGRPAVIARAWLMRAYETAHLAASRFEALPPVDALAPFQPAEEWPGGFVETVDVRRAETARGRAQVWVRPQLPLVEGETISPTARMLGVIDIANGMTPIAAPVDVLFPNLDLTAHLFRAPQGEWIGFDTTVGYGPGGLGLTHTVLSDADGALGASSQSLTVRPRG